MSKAPHPIWTPMHSFPEGVRVVGIVEFQGRIIIATDTAGIYTIVGDVVTPLPVEQR